MFPGGVYSDAVPHGHALGELSVTPEAVAITTRDGMQLGLPLSQCRLEHGGASGRRWVCHNDDRSLTLYSEALGFGESLAAQPSLQAQVEALTRRARGRTRRERKWLLGSVLALLLVVVGGYYGIRAAAGAAMRALPVSVDQRIGQEAIARIDLGGPRVEDPQLREAVQRIVDRLSPHASRPGFKFEVHVVESATVNAFALPGGNIVVFTGLLRAAADPAEVAGVLGHEMAHVTARHGMQRIGHTLGVAAAINLLLGDVGGLSGLAVEMLQAGTLTSYGRDQEREADLDAVRMLHRAGIDPRGLARFFATLRNEQPKAGLGVTWLSSHPELSERERAVLDHARTFGPLSPRPLELDWPALRSRAQRLPAR